MPSTSTSPLFLSLLFPFFAFADSQTAETELYSHSLHYSQLIAETCSTQVTQQDREQNAFRKMSSALANAQVMDRQYTVTPSLLEQMHKLLPRYIDCASPAQTQLEPIVDSFISFLAVNRKLPSDERRAYIKYAMKLSEIDSQSK
ncbi:hypothetical protein A1OK_01050 [Enterovibrio norvegicus FF-454]|uniref:Uncharacterized protein n=1 Tax=Enterovibrio norvegicus FF-454 TaxID=1185651 RepID=A0A1E5C9C4_9GAMM|nr:hypothetical protein [Enterovibrio norvegicus]OEE62123.1 hypothetical protein A1OK_01050 [Enterovibrio norvegicus FF-454]